MQFYGTTETFIITLLRPEQHHLDDPGLLKSCGQPMPGVELRIADANGRDVPAREAGEVLVRSPWMFSGYWNKPDATAAAIRAAGITLAMPASATRKATFSSLTA